MSGLALPKDVGVSEREAEARERAWQTVDRVNARMAARGLDQNEEPTMECPPVTAELLLSPDVREYTKVFAAQLRWYNYVVLLVADVRAVILEIDNAMGDIASSKRIALREHNKHLPKVEKIAVNEMADLVEQDVAYRTLKQQLQVYEQERLKLDARAETLERNLKTISRQIENRRTEGQAGNREANMPGASQGRWEDRMRRTNAFGAGGGYGGQEG